MALVFQYGSNISETRINSPERLNGAAKFVGVAFTVYNFELDFTVWSSSNNCAAADLISGYGRKIWGVLYDIPEERIYREQCPRHLKSLDAIEGQGKNYERKSINVRWADGTEINEPVLTYLAKNRSLGLKTNEIYVSHILSGLASHQIPEEYIDYVRSRVITNNPELESKI